MTHIGTVRHGVSEWPLFWSRFAPDRPAILYQDRTISWRELEERSARLAGGLRKAGIAKGDRVGFLALNTPEFFEVLIACARIGAIFVPFNIRLTPAEMAHMATDAGLRLLVADEHFADRLDALADQVDAASTYFLDGPPEGGRPLDDLLGDPVRFPDDVTLDDVLLLAYTSGTTGRSKAAVITHGNAAATSIAVINADGLRPSDRVALPAPLAFAGSMLSISLPFLHVGGSMLIERTFDAERMLDQIEHGGITLMKLVPAIYQMMAATPGFAERDLSGIRSCTCGGAPVPVDLLRTYQQHGLNIGGAYGLTEGCGFNLHLPPHEALERAGWTGLPIPFQRVRVVDGLGADAEPHEVGELLIKGQCVMQGYWQATRATASAIRDGWLHTGDLAIRDEDGYIKIVDRLKDMIISGGINVYPAEVERVLREHPDVVEAAVVGTTDPRWGETPVACVISKRADLTLEDLQPLLRRELADYKRPRRLELMTDLPRNANGKVLKRDLRARVDQVPAKTQER